MVVATVGLAVCLLALAALGFRLAGGNHEDKGVTDTPSRLDPLPSTTTVPGASPSTTAPPVGASGVPALDTSAPKIRITDADGRFQVTVPRSWVTLPAVAPDTVQFRLFEQAADGTIQPSDFLFVVRWFESKGQTLDRCVAEHVLRLQNGRPSVVVTSTPQTVAGRAGARLDSSVADQRLAGWLVLRGDRYWSMDLIGPPTGFDQILAVVQPVLATMSFG